MNRTPAKSCPPRRADVAVAELHASADTLVRHLDAHPGQVRGLLLAELFGAVLGDLAPPALRGLVMPVITPDGARAEGLAYIAASLWRRLLQLEQLTPGRAAAIASRLAPLLQSPALIYSFEIDAAEAGAGEARACFAATLDERFAGLRPRLDRLPIDRELLEGAGFDLARLQICFHASGHLASVRPRGRRTEGPSLTLDARPGSGHYTQTGKRGGYGFHVDEHYRAGHACGVLCSPWHDGEDYRTKKPWLRWVLENIAEIRDSAR